MFLDRKNVHYFYLLVDIILVSTSFFLPYTLYYNYFNSGVLIYIREYSLVFAIWAVTLFFILNNYHLFSTDRTLTIPLEIWRVIKAVFFSSVLAALFIFGFQIMNFSRLLFFASSGMLILSLSLWRTAKRIWVRDFILKGNFNFNTLIVGAGRSAQMLVEEIRNNPYLGIRVIGFLDDYKSGMLLGLPILGKVSELKKIVRKNFVDEIYITIPSEREKVSGILMLCKELSKSARVLVDNFNFSLGQVGMNYIGLTPLVSYYERELHGSEKFAKRLMDLAISVTTLITLLPLLVIIVFLIKLDSPGPILYVSKRCGKKGRVFNFYKFRSMYLNSEKLKDELRQNSEVSGPIFKIKKDPRVTPLGKLLRRYSLDELPQLINVIRGDMSLIGPRPPTPDEVAKYDFWQMRRLEIRPGLTCLWQVRGRSDLSFYKLVKWDLWYIDNWSFGLDIKILLLTIPAVLKGEGAY